VVEFVRRGIAAKQELHLICENMMDNCLASNSETGGVGCDNMTMIVIGLLNGKSKKEWYDLIGKRVADGDGPCAPPEYGKFCSCPRDQVFSNKYFAAEFRGPGVRHQFDNESPDEYELDLDKRSRGFGGRGGRIILLGDGTEVLTDSDDTEMFDHSDEDKDTENQIQKGTPATSDNDSTRSEREGTPAPQPQAEASKATDSPSSTNTEQSEHAGPTMKAASDTINMAEHSSA
jgi:protein phosphatase 2C family protein 2/3